jgi:RNA polymerase sigma-54 factor
VVAMDLGYDLDQEQRQRNLPRLIEANYLLHLSSQELETVISTELTSNPALEIDETITCPVCGTTLESGACPTCLINHLAPAQPGPDEENDRFDALPSQPSSDEEFDAVSLIADDYDVLGQMIADAHAVLPERDHPIVDLIVNAIDERGFLTSELEEIATITGRTIEEVERVLAEIQELAPAGVAARDLRESLLLQIRFLREDGLEVSPLVEQLANEHLQALGAHRYHHLSRELRRSVDEIAEAHDFIRVHLSPHPLQDSQARTWQQTAQTPLVVPDVLITIDEGELHVEVVGHSQARLRVNDLYEELAQQLRRRSAQAVAGDAVVHASDEDRHHIRDSVTRAKQFISKLEQRRETLLRISACICQMQEDFLREGVRELRPLTRSEVAAQVGVHESTVSRATANKFVMLPNRKVIPFSDFFTPSLSIKDVIKELIEQESSAGQALSDMRIRDLLMDRGYRIARRTVAKYRAELRILPSTVR